MPRESKPNRELKRARQLLHAAQEHGDFIPISRTSTFSGPIPSPDILAGYEQALPGTADRIISMTESEMSHRQSIETTSINAQARDIHEQRIEVRFGQIGAVIIGVAGLIVCAYCATHGSPVVGGGVGGGTVVSLVGAFLYRNYSSTKASNPTPKPKDDDIAIPALQIKDKPSESNQ